MPQPSVFTMPHALHATQSCQEKAVCLSVKRVICDKTKESLPTFLYHMTDHLY